jgi:uncharacterized protein YbaP (TraB family)
LLILCSLAAFGQSAVWELTKDGNTLYLGGSVHVLREEDFPLPGEFGEALNRSDILVLEADMDLMTDGEFLKELMPRMYLSGTNLKNLLSPGVYNDLAALCKEQGLPLFQIIRMKPMIVSTMLSTLRIRQLGFVEKGVDAVLLEQAKAKGKERIFLESVEFQVGLLLDIGMGHADEIIRDALQDFADSGESLVQIISEWRKGMPEEVERDLAEMKESFPMLYITLIQNRNNEWIPQIERFLRTGETEFILVGYAHLHGPDGLLRRLREMGVGVKQLNIPQ